jgi:hypothetical protein
MKIVIAYNKPFIKLAKIFYSTIPQQDDYEIISLYIDSFPTLVQVFSPEYNTIATIQYETFLNTLQSIPKNQTVCMLDIDIQFFDKPFVGIMNECLGSNDFAFQWDNGCLNAGIMIAKNNSTTTDFLYYFINDWLKPGKCNCKWPTLTKLIKANNIKYTLLPKQFYLKTWGDPELDIILHHAYGDYLSTKIENMINVRKFLNCDLTFNGALPNLIK